MTAPLAGVTIVDVSRMLPGAVLARGLIDLGARLIKVEDPHTGDLMRLAPPLVDGVGVGYCVFYRGAESVGLDLREPDGAAALRHLVARADVLIESFRPGTMARYGLGLPDLRAAHPRLITCSLPGFAGSPEGAASVGHDLNFTGMTGLLRKVADAGIPSLQIADVTTGLLACTAILAALLRRGVTGEGGAIEQPLLAGPLPFVAWPYAEAVLGGGGMSGRVLGGRAPAYRCYRCADGLELSVGCLEPKFWVGFTAAVGRPDLAPLGLDLGPDGEAAAAAMQAWLAARPRDHWLAKIADHALPVWPVHDLDAAAREPALAPLLEPTPLPDGTTSPLPGPFIPSLGRTPESPVPGLAAHTRSVLAEFAVPADLVDRLAR